MKRLIIVMLLVTLIFGVVACNSNAEKPNETTASVDTNDPDVPPEDIACTVLETLGQGTAKLNHKEEIIGTKYFSFDKSTLGSYVKRTKPKNISFEVEDGIFQEAEYVRSHNGYYYDSQYDLFSYSETEDGIYLEICKKVNSGEVFSCLYDKAEFVQSDEAATPLSSNECLEIVKDHFYEHVGSKEIADQFVFKLDLMTHDSYKFIAERRINGVKTYETVIYDILIGGRIAYYSIDIDKNMDVSKCPTALQMKSIENKVNDKLKEIYNVSIVESYDRGTVEPLFVRLANGDYAVEYYFKNMRVDRPYYSESQDTTRLFVILE